jgi:hypothetical protein
LISDLFLEIGRWLFDNVRQFKVPSRQLKPKGCTCLLQLLCLFCRRRGGGGVVISHAQVADSSWIVKLNSCDSQTQFDADVAALISLFGGAVAQSWALPICAARFSKINASIASNISFNYRVAFVEQNGLLHVADTQNLKSGNVNLNPNLDRIDQRQNALDFKFRFPHNGAGVKIYVVDTGVVPTGDLSGRVTLGTSILAGGTATVDFVGHGTAMASLAASLSLGVGKGATIVPIKVSDSVLLNLNNVVSGLQYILAQNDGLTSVVNLSLNGSSTSGATGMLETLISQLKSANYVVVAAAGNENAAVSTITPGRSPDAITAGASVVSTGSRWIDTATTGSNFGPEIDVFAPAVDAKVYNTTGGLVLATGTSGAAALTSGAVSSLRQTQLTEINTPTLTQSRLEAASTQGVLTNLNGSVNRLLFSDVRPSRINQVYISSDYPCFNGVGSGILYSNSVRQVIADSSNNTYLLSYHAVPNSGACLGPQFRVTKISSADVVLWKKQVLGLSALNQINRIALDSDGNLVGVGQSTYCAGGASCAGGSGAVVFKLNASNGTELFRTFVDSPGVDRATAITTAVVNLNGTNTNILTLAGTTTGTVGASSLGATDGFVARVNSSSGAISFVTQFGSSADDDVTDLVSFNGQLALSGNTLGSMPGLSSLGGQDGFLSTVLVQPSANFVFSGSQIGTAGADSFERLNSKIEGFTAVLFAGGKTSASFAGFTNVGGTDSFVMRLHDTLTSSIWLKQFGTTADDAVIGQAMTADDLFIGAGSLMYKLSQASGEQAWNEPVSSGFVANDNIRNVINCATDSFSQINCTRFRSF